MSAAKITTKKYYRMRKYSPILDGVAIGHFLLCNVIIILGPLTPLSEWVISHFSEMQSLVVKFVKAYPEIYFVYAFIDRPILYLFPTVLIDKPHFTFITYLYAELAFMGGSVLYSAIVYFLMKPFKFFR